MRKVLLLATLLASSACGTADQWHRPGADLPIVDDDLRQCWHEALQETMRIYAAWHPFAFDTEPFWNFQAEPTRRAVRRSNELSQVSAEHALADACMRTKGYTIGGD